MNWDAVRAGLEDELEKISISLMGFSPETVLNRPETPPMQTDGLAKALQILQKAEQYEMPKVAWARRALEDTDNRYEKIRPWVNRGLAGAGAGTLLTGLTSNAPTLKHRLIGAGVGAGASLADHAYARHRRHIKNVKGGMLKKAAFRLGASGNRLMGARNALAISRRAATPARSMSGPGLKSQIPRIPTPGPIRGL